MWILRRGVDPDIQRSTDVNTWKCKAKHKRCGTVVELVQSDVEAGATYYGGGMFDDGGEITYARWKCPICPRDNVVELPERKYPVWMRRFMQNLRNELAEVRRREDK